MLSRLLRLLLLLSCFLLVSCGTRTVTPPPSINTDPDGPRLAVVVVFDQLRADYLTRWQDLFGEDGFRRLEREGAWFQDCHYPYADTVTAAGHASIHTGCSPMTHGIIANDWYDRAAGVPVSCVASDRYERVPPPPPGKDGRRMRGAGSSPDRLLVPTLGDALKTATGGKARIVSLSFKDRSAVLPGGHQPDGCYWFDTSTGTFVTSTYYRDRLHPWVEEFNRGRLADRWFGEDWTRLRPDLDYVYFSGPDDVAGEGKGFGQGRTFPHPMTGGKKEIGKDYYQALYNSPFGNELLLELADKALTAEELGHHDVPDLLCLSFSCNDAIGHSWGPDSQEVLDVTLRTDRIVQELLARLDAKVGKGRYFLVLTADHGVCPLPEVSRSQGRDAGRYTPEQLSARVETFLDEKYGANANSGHWLAATAPPWLYLNRALLRQRRLAQSDVEQTLADWLVTQDGIQAAYTRTQLLQGVAADDSVGQGVWRSFQSERAGDLMIVLKPYWIIWYTLTGTTHGSLNPYDTHVPLLVYGPGIHPGVRQDRVTPQATAVILAHGLGMAPPANAEAKLPPDLFETQPVP